MTSRKDRRDLWTWPIVVAVTFLIWYWAAGETRDSRTANFTVRMSVPAEGWLVEPSNVSVEIDVEGSRRALRNVEDMDTTLSIPLKPEVGVQNVDLSEAIRAMPVVVQTGARVLTVEPRMVDVRVDELISIPAAVEHRLGPDYQQVTVDPPQATITMPRGIRPLFPEELVVEPTIPRDQLTDLTPGSRNNLENVRLRFPEAYPSREHVEISPRFVRLAFDYRAQIRTLELDSVRIQVAGPAEDQERVELEPKQLRNVSIEGPTDLIDRIEAGEVVVVAVLHLKSSEKLERIPRKRITYLMALPPSGLGRQVRFVEIDGSPLLPMIELDITDPNEET